MASTRTCQSELSLNGLRILARIGYSAEERAEPQYVRFDIRVAFDSLPKGCTSDLLEETICYARITDEIARVTQKKEYRLIEALGYQAFVAVRELLRPNQKLWLKITKENPPLPLMNEGASFILQD